MNKKVSIIYYTNNLTPKKLIEKTLISILDISNKFKIKTIISSQFPISKNPIIEIINKESFNEDLDKLIVDEEIVDESKYEYSKFYVIGKSKRSLENLSSQILFTLSKVDTEYVILTEDDVLYPEEYFENIFNNINKNLDIIYQKNFVFFCKNGFYNINENTYLSRYSGKKEYFEKYFKNKLKNIQNFEPILLGFSKMHPFLNYHEDDICKNLIILDNKNPVLDIKHGLNLCGCQIVKQYYDFNNYWGNKDIYYDLIRNDNIDDFLKEKPNYIFGLDVNTKKSGKIDLFDILQRFFK